MRLLARREHSRRELERKLAARGWPVEAIAGLLDELADQGLQSDARFAESYARARIERAYGPMRIRAELAERGVDKLDAETALKTLSPDWRAIAAAWHERRYGTAPLDSAQEKARRVQALARRGFLHEHIRGLLDP